MQHQAAVEVPARLDSRDALEDPFRRAADKPPLYIPGILSVQPLFVLEGGVDGAVERLCPFHVRGVVVRVRDDNRLEPSQGCDLRSSEPPRGTGGRHLGREYLLNCSLVQERDQVPQHIAMLRLQQDCPLAYAELPQSAPAFIPYRHPSRGPPCAISYLWLSPHGLHPMVKFILLPFILERTLPHLPQGGEGLPDWWDELAGILDRQRRLRSAR